MQNPIGIADGGATHLKPLHFKPVVQTGGCFSANLGGLLPGKQLGIIPSEVEIALLNHPPVPEGIGYVEFDCPGYARQTARLIPGSGSGIDVNAVEIAFELAIAAWAPATHIAIMAKDDRVLFSAPLVQIGIDRQRPMHIYLRPHDFAVRRP